MAQIDSPAPRIGARPDVTRPTRLPAGGIARQRPVAVSGPATLVRSATEPRLGGSLLAALTKDVAAQFNIPFQNTGQVLLGYAIAKVRTLWQRPSADFEIVAIDGRSFLLQRTPGGLLAVDTSAMPIPGLEGSTSMTIRGKFEKGDTWTRANVARGDPVALIFERAVASDARGGGFLLPARYGEAFEVTAPRGPYRISAFAIDRYGASLRSNRTVRALGYQDLGAKRTILGREKVDLMVRPSVSRLDYRSSAWRQPFPLNPELAPREHIQLLSPLTTMPNRPSVAPTRRTTPERCVAGTSDGRCRGTHPASHDLCAKHLMAAANGKNVRRFDDGTLVRARCDRILKNGDRCDRRAIVTREGQPLRAYCRKHMEAGEPEPGRCRALTRAGVRCSNAVMLSHGELCSSHDSASGEVHHYATSAVTYV